MCVPAFFFALLTIFLFAIHLDWLPAGGFRTVGIEKFSLLDNLKHVILPAFVLTMGNLAEYVRFTRASMLDVMQSDFATVGEGKGSARADDHLPPHSAQCADPDRHARRVERGLAVQRCADRGDGLPLGRGWAC